MQDANRIEDEINSTVANTFYGEGYGGGRAEGPGEVGRRPRYSQPVRDTSSSSSYSVTDEELTSQYAISS